MTARYHTATLPVALGSLAVMRSLPGIRRAGDELVVVMDFDRRGRKVWCAEFRTVRQAVYAMRVMRQYAKEMRYAR